jgi:cytoskeletal protein CcmA (bactofilin family)
MFLRSRQQARNGGTGTALVVTQPRHPRPPFRSTAPSIIAADLHIVGNVSTEGELHIDGRIDGDVQARSVTIGDSGHVVGHVETDAILVQGIVSGSVRARKVHLAPGCKVIADIAHGSLTIDEEASFEGQCRRVADDERPGGLDLEESPA